MLKVKLNYQYIIMKRTIDSTVHYILLHKEILILQVEVCLMQPLCKGRNDSHKLTHSHSLGPPTLTLVACTLTAYLVTSLLTHLRPLIFSTAYYSPCANNALQPLRAYLWTSHMILFVICCMLAFDLRSKYCFVLNESDNPTRTYSVDMSGYGKCCQACGRQIDMSTGRMHDMQWNLPHLSV